MKYGAIVVGGADNVATALRPLVCGENVSFSHEGDREIVLKNDVRFGHKFAISEIKKSGAVKKYGETIGQATCDISLGEHVHTHNVESMRGRGDKQ